MAHCKQLMAMSTLPTVFGLLVFFIYLPLTHFVLSFSVLARVLPLFMMRLSYLWLLLLRGETLCSATVSLQVKNAMEEPCFWFCF